MVSESTITRLPPLISIEPPAAHSQGLGLQGAVRGNKQQGDSTVRRFNVIVVLNASLAAGSPASISIGYLRAYNGVGYQNDRRPNRPEYIGRMIESQSKSISQHQYTA